MSHRLIYFGLSFFMISCGDPAETINVNKTERIPVVLEDDELFASNKVLAFLQNEKKFIEDANAFFLKGINSFRNKKDLDSADYYLRKSILKEPTARAYFELGNLYQNKKKFGEALLAYDLAEQLDYKPFSKLLYNKSCLYSIQEKNEMSGKYLEYAIQAGYNNIEHIAKDSDLKSLRESHYYNEAVERGLRGTSDAKNLFWLSFKKEFGPANFPQKLKQSMNIEELNALKYISFDFEKYISEMRNEEFSREVSKGFYYFSQPYETEKFVALIYVVKDEFMGELAPLTYRMATFTHEGKLIDKKDIAGSSNYSEELKEATLTKNRVINVKYFKPIYKEDPDLNGFYDNEIIKKNLLGSTTITISANGKIVEESLKNAN